MPGLCHRIGSAGMVLAALVAFGSGAAQAAPQVLALIATNGKVDLVREGRACSAELTSFCLDVGRFSPAPGTAYHLAGAADVRLVGTAADGRSLSLDPQAFLRFESARSHVAVRVANRMINLLPPGGAGGEFGGEALWRRATQASGPDDLSPEARKRARGACVVTTP